MTREDKNKEFKLKDLCARLPYGVKVIHKDETGKKKIITTLVGYTGYYAETFIDGLCYHLELCDFKPYLRPMSSMTEEEARDWAKASNMQFDMEDGFLDCYDAYLSVEWLDKNMFDHRKNDKGKTMIEAGLALEAPADMYNFK